MPRLPLGRSVLVLILICCAGPLALRAAEDDLLDIDRPAAKRPKTAAAGDLLEPADQRVLLRLVQAADPTRSIDERVYWRTVQGVVAAQIAPIEFRLGDVEWIGPEAAPPDGGADREQHPLARGADFADLAPPIDYLEPDTLATARAVLIAKQIAGWQPAATAKPQTELAGRGFYAVDAKIELSAAGAKHALLHFVYRRGAANRSLVIVTSDGSGETRFELDLPTSSYRVVDLPLRGAPGQVAIVPDGAVEVAECSLWNCEWPATNLCFVPGAASAGDASSGAAQPASGDLDDLLDDAGPADSKRAATCKIYCANSDVDRVAGTYLPVPVDPLRIADGRRFEAGTLPGWAPANTAFAPMRGAFVVFVLGKPSPVGLVVTYDRALKQSLVSRRMAVFTTEQFDDVTSGRVLASDSANDQFWRLFSLPAEGKLSGFGVHVFSGAGPAAGLSEVEAYK